MKQFEKTHPWITFQVDLRDVPYSLWMKLGECTSKIEHISRVPLVHDSAADLYKIYLAKGVHATTAIEGNTLSEEDVLRHIEGELELPPSREYLAQEIDNVIKAINITIEGMREGSMEPLETGWIKDTNRAVLDKLNQQEGSIPGTIRTHSVGGRYRGAPAEDCEYLLDRLCRWLRPETASGHCLAAPCLSTFPETGYSRWQKAPRSAAENFKQRSSSRRISAYYDN